MKTRAAMKRLGDVCIFGNSQGLGDVSIPSANSHGSPKLDLGDIRYRMRYLTS